MEIIILRQIMIRSLTLLVSEWLRGIDEATATED